MPPGLPEERSQYINADHRHICKFHSEQDANYIVLRNALASTVIGILQDGEKQQTVKHRAVIDIYLQMTLWIGITVEIK